MYGNDGYSESVRNFLDENRPKTVQLDLGLIKKLIKDNKLDSLEKYAQPSLKIVWFEKFSDDRLSVVFRPSYHTSGESGQGNRLAELLFQKLNLVEVSVPLPEKVIEMPIPSWVWANDADSNGFVVEAYTTTMFLSEAVKVRDEFLKKLEDIG